MDNTQPPKTFRDFVARFPVLGEAHQRLGREVESLGPLDTKECALIKIGISLGAGLESALRSHVRRATRAGASREEIELGEPAVRTRRGPARGFE